MTISGQFDSTLKIKKYHDFYNNKKIVNFFRYC